MSPSIVLQVYITLTAPTAVYLLGHRYRKTACIAGLCSQVSFLALFLVSNQLIMLIPTAIYTLSWISNWRSKDIKGKHGIESSRPN